MFPPLLQRLFMMEDQEVILGKMEDPDNAVEFRDATLVWSKARPPPEKSANPQQGQKRGGMRRVLRREKLSLYISSEDEKAKVQEPNAEHLLTHMEQESPQSTISSTQSVRPPLHKTLHRIQLTVRRVRPTSHTHLSQCSPFLIDAPSLKNCQEVHYVSPQTVWHVKEKERV